jgi:N-acetylneuraminic acid mutarotase
MGGSGFDANGNVSFLNDLWSYNTATSQWTWLSGNNLVNQVGVYGTKGTEAPANVPGARQSALTWQDANGLWLMGGTNGSGYLNDVWKWNPSTNGWTWVSGLNTVNPPAVYETKGVASTTALPGGRQFTAAWSSGNGTVFLLGGVGLNANSSVVTLNDFWTYTNSTNQWTWLSGSDAAIRLGVYGTRGVRAATNQPGGRRSVAGAAGFNGTYWMFGGQGFGETGSVGFLNDLWRFDGGEWTWVSGSKIPN